MSLFPHTSTVVETGLATTVTPMLQKLSVNEERALWFCEDQIRKGLGTFREVGEALASIRDQRLYRAEFGSFKEYCLKRWGMTSRRARQLEDAASVVRNLLPAGGAEVQSADRKEQSGEPGKEQRLLTSSPTVPATESQARPLARLTAEEQREAWDHATAEANHNGRAVTARDVEEAAEMVKPRRVTAEKETEETKEPEFALGLEAPSYASPRMRSILIQAGDIVARMGALEQMLAEAGDVTCLHLLNPAREKMDRIVACYVEERAERRDIKDGRDGRDQKPVRKHKTGPSARARLSR